MRPRPKSPGRKRTQIAQRQLGSYTGPADATGMWLEVVHVKPRSSRRGYIHAIWHRGNGETHQIVYRRIWPAGNSPIGHILSNADLVRFAEGLATPAPLQTAAP